MRIDIKGRIDIYQKKQKMSLIMTIIFLVLTITSIVLFIVFSNYKIQLLMSLVGSAASSILVILTLIAFLGGYKQNKYLVRFYTQLENKEEQPLKGKVALSNKYLTLKKRLSFLVVYIDKEEYYLVNQEMVELLKDKEECHVILRGNYIVEIVDHE